VSKPDLIPVSAKTGENQDLVQEKIWDYLASKKGKDVLAYLVQRFNTYVDQYLEKLAERAKFLDEDLKQRETHCQQLGVEIEKYRIAKENFLAKLRQSLRPELENFRERISVIFDQNINLLQTEINNLQFECNDVAMVNKRLAAKLSYFQRRLASELGKAETQLFNIIRVRIEEQKSNLKIPPKRQQIWQDYISDWNTKPVVGNLTISGAGQIISAGTAVGGIGTFIGAASYTAATAETTIAATGWKALTAWFVGSEATTAAASSILTVGIPALAVAAIGISIFLALRHYSATETGRKVQFIGDELISKFEQVKIDVLSYIESNLEDRINEICANVDNDILTFYEQKRTEMDFLMLQSEQPHHHHAIEKNLSALKLPVNL
jgi:hypothetical protein